MGFDKKALETSREGTTRTLLESLSYSTGAPDYDKYVVPKGFETNYGSIPRLVRPLFSNEDWAIVMPSVLHDYLYSTGKVSRRKADKIFYRALRENMSFIKARIIWLGVRAGGWAYYK